MVQGGRARSIDRQVAQKGWPASVFLREFSVDGFRSLMNVDKIPISSPTILAGHNDGGKSALIASLAFLLGSYKVTEDDRTYISRESDAPGDSDKLERCPVIDVCGTFSLNAEEQLQFSLPAQVEIRRRATDDGTVILEHLVPTPDDSRLRDLAQHKVPQLKELVDELDLRPASTLRAGLVAALTEYAQAHSANKEWLPVPAQIQKRIPEIIFFDGLTADPDDAVKAALMGRFQAHLADESLHGRVAEIESDIKERIRTDAKSLCDHIQSRCLDLTEISVEPDISFTHGFRGTHIRIARRTGESVGLERSGLGVARRISLAIWEWTSRLLADDNATRSESVTDESSLGINQTIVVYDEPDTHLDYAHQRQVMKLIREQCGIPGVNVVVATHSMNLIDGVDISDVIHLKLEQGRTVVERLGSESHDSIDHYLGKVAAGLGLRNSVLLHERCFLAVEGATEQQAIPLLFRLSEGIPLQSAGIALWSCENNEGALRLAQYLVEHGRTVMLMVDGDSRNLPKSIFKEDRLRAHFGPKFETIVKFIGEPEGANEFEELFPDDLWATVANKLWPKDSIWTAEDFLAHRGNKFSSGVQKMLQEQSLQGPTGKPQMMQDLALALDSPDQIPNQLREIFTELRRLAG